MKAEHVEVLKALDKPLSRCRCGQVFRQMDPENTFTICLDCRDALGDKSRREGGRDAAEYMQMSVGYRLKRGFSLIGQG